jgi:hypothetical protein
MDTSVGIAVILAALLLVVAFLLALVVIGLFGVKKSKELAETLRAKWMRKE